MCVPKAWDTALALNMLGKFTVDSLENGALPAELEYESADSVIEAIPVVSLFEHDRIDSVHRFEEVHVPKNYV